jgi:hypothetical protein
MNNWISYLALLSLAAAISTAQAEYQPLSGPQVRHLLSGQVATGQNFVQTFGADGSTTYVYQNGNPSRGSWRVEGDKYCSKWPPAGGWACYDMTRESAGDNVDRVRWIDATGDVTDANIARQ